MAARMTRSLEERMTNDMRPISLLGPCEDTAIELPVRFSCDRTGLAATGAIPNGIFLEPSDTLPKPFSTELENQTLRTLSLLVILRRANPDPTVAGPDSESFLADSDKASSPAFLPTPCRSDPSLYIRANRCPRCFSTSATNLPTSANRPLTYVYIRVDWVLLPRFTPFATCPAFETLRESAASSF